MFYEWRDGWLWKKETPDGVWWPANTDEVIRALADRVNALEARPSDMNAEPAAVSAQ